ncbi:MAG TPA: glycosyltransferase [Chthoniobacterales bacterium]|nr:glycosyltransferase [Chthoniobacterales bacterium]
MCRISVITIFLNSEAFITEAIDSVLAQSFRSFEFILVDDGSTDASSAIARRYAETYPDRVRYIDHPGHANRGMSASRNAGISVSRGNLIAFNDADDVWLPNKLQEQVAILDAHPEVGLVAGATIYWDSWRGGADRAVVVGHVQNQVVCPPDALRSVYPLAKAEPPAPSSVMVRRSVVERVGGFEASFTGMYQMYEDQAFLVKVYLSTPVYFSDRIWFKYRQHDSSCVAENVRAGRYHVIRQHFLAWFAGHLTEVGFTESEVWRKLRWAILPYRRPRLYRILRAAYLSSCRVRSGIKRRWSPVRDIVTRALRWEARRRSDSEKKPEEI